MCKDPRIDEAALDGITDNFFVFKNEYWYRVSSNGQGVLGFGKIKDWSADIGTPLDAAFTLDRGGDDLTGLTYLIKVTISSVPIRILITFISNRTSTGLPFETKRRWMVAQ